MARWLYRCLLLFLIPALIVRLLWRARRQREYLHHLAERFGHYSIQPKKPVLWLHAVSVGETRAAQPLILALADRHPDHQLLITCMTPTGRDAAESLYGKFALVVYLPYDFASAQRRFLCHWRPRIGVLMETELWPNLLFEAQSAQIPMALINARLSARSAKGYARFSALARPALATLDAVAAQTQEDAERLSAVGAPSPIVCGNLKFEVTPPADRLQLGQHWRQQAHEVFQGSEPSPPFFWLAASTREGEEWIILDAYEQLCRRQEKTLLVLVPRHPQRFKDVAAEITRRGLKMHRRSAGLPSHDTQVWLGDSMGEMAAYFAMADGCVMGGSLLPFGSQNLIEACACGCPVLIGPSDFNFRQAARDAIDSGAAERIGGNAESLANAICQWKNEPSLLQERKQAALRFTALHRGATQRTQAVLDGLLR